MVINALLTKYKVFFEKILCVIARVFVKTGLKPDYLTILSLLLSATAFASALFFPI